MLANRNRTVTNEFAKEYDLPRKLTLLLHLSSAQSAGIIVCNISTNTTQMNASLLPQFKLCCQKSYGQIRTVKHEWGMQEM